jgi:hypothetical protein
MSLVGRLEDLALPDIFQIVSLSRKTGALVVTGREGKGVVVFRNGQVIQAAADFIKEDLGEILLSGEIIRKKDLDLAIEIKKMLPEDKPIEEVFLEMGIISRETLEEVNRHRIEDIVYRLLLWQDGDFSFELGEGDLKERVKMNHLGYPLQYGMSPEYLIMESTRLYDERRKEAEGFLPKRPSPKFEPLEEKIEEEEKISEEEWEEEDFLGRGREDRKTLSSLKAMITELRFPAATSEITLLILRYASDVVNRGILFMVKKAEIVGLGQFGIEIKGESPDQRVRDIRIPVDEPSIFSKVLEARQTYKGAIEENRWNDYLINEIGGANPLEVFVIPLISEGRVIAVLYGDNLPEMKPIGDIEGLEIFINQAGLAMEKALLERKIMELERMRRKETERRY